MAKIERVEVLMVDLKPKVKRTDAIQSFVSQETPIVRIYADDGAVGTGYTYTIGTGGHAVIELIARNAGDQTRHINHAVVHRALLGLPGQPVGQLAKQGLVASHPSRQVIKPGTGPQIGANRL